MGALHDGHLSLIRAAARENTDVFVSIFVNPTQFGVNEDLAAYPRTWDSDMAQLQELNREFSLKLDGTKGEITGIFAPTVETMYPTLPPSSETDGNGSFILITPLGRKLEGNSRPVFFRGVATVCAKLFNIVQPERVYFGQKDIQQSVLIRRMVTDFHVPTDVRVVPTSREVDGLAMSSRNVQLGERRRPHATVLYKALKAAETAYLSGENSANVILARAQEAVEEHVLFLAKEKKLPLKEITPFKIDYISLTDPFEMDEIEGDVDPKVGGILSGAVYILPVMEPKTDEERALMPVRLIDNIILPPR